MNYKNKIILTNENKNNCIINEQFNEWLNKNEYYIIDIELLAQDLGRIITDKIKQEELPYNSYTINRLIRNYICDTFEEIKSDLEEEITEYIYNNR